jgi:hypothetical protein
LIGCCTVPSTGEGTITSESCYYMGTSSSLDSTCTSSLHGTWSTTQ